LAQALAFCSHIVCCLDCISMSMVQFLVALLFVSMLVGSSGVRKIQADKPMVEDTTSSSGVCPDATFQFVACVAKCESDSQCEGGKLCCSTGCGTECMSPVNPKTAPSRPCALTAALTDTMSSAEALATVPTPEQETFLSSARLLLLNYGTARDDECCEAAQLLKSMPSIRFVEFDWKPPSACAKLP